jgi:hypothetical protein
MNKRLLKMTTVIIVGATQGMVGIFARVLTEEMMRVNFCERRGK